MHRSRVLRGLTLTLVLTGMTAAVWTAASCKSNTTPTQTPPSPTPTPTAAPTPAPGVVSGVVTDTSTLAGVAVSGATVEIQGKSATTGADGRYSIGSLTAGAAPLTVTHQGHDTVTQSVTVVAGTTTTVNISMSRAFAAALAGNWSGQWRNVTFGSTGSATMAVSADTVAQTFRVTLDLNGLVFGLSDPLPQTFSGSYTPTAGADVHGTTLLFGDLTLKVTPTGQITGSVSDLSGPTVSRLDFTGTATATLVTINYTVMFTAGGTAVGVLTMIKP
jgi:hypothetical protein